METAATKPAHAGADPSTSRRSPWAWIPTLYYAQGLPFVAVNVLSIVLYKRLGLTNTEIALYTSWFYLPWVIKPLWSPIVEIFKTKRLWIVLMQLVIGAGLAGVALSIPAGNFVQYTLMFFWLLAFSSATHDIAADGFYMLGLSKHDQAWFVGVRSTFFRLAMITGQGFLVMLAGYFENHTGLAPVEVRIQAVASAEAVTGIAPESFAVPRADDLRVVAHPEIVTIAPVPRDPEDITALIAEAKEWNQRNGFYTIEEPPAPAPSWWQRNVSARWSKYISEPLGGTLRRLFPKQDVSPAAPGGNIGVIYFAVSQPLPEGEKRVVNFAADTKIMTFSGKSGDRNIRLLEGERFTFTHENSDKPFVAVVQLDPKFAGETEARYTARVGDIPLAWSITFFILAGLFVIFCVYHRFILPRPPADHPAVGTASNAVSAFFLTLGSFFQKPGVLTALAFILVYRFAEAQLVRLAGPFLLDGREVGGLALSTGAVGFVYGTVGVIALTVGGILGGFAAARNGLRFWMPAMVCAINVPNLVYVYLAMAQPNEFLIINLCVAIEQFGYGFGFAAFLLYMIYFAEGEQKTSHYAICTGFMALGMMLPGMFSGWIQDIIGYQNFFVWVLLATIPSFLVAAMAYRRLDPNFGRKAAEG